MRKGIKETELKSELRVIPQATNLSYYINLQILKQQMVDKKQIKNTKDKRLQIKKFHMILRF